MHDERHFIPRQVTGSWQLFGLSPRHLLRLLPLPVVMGVGVLIVVLIWGAVPGPGMTRMVLRSLYLLLFPVGMSVAWVGLMVIPAADAGRTWYDVLMLASAHSRRQTVFLPRRMMGGASLPKPAEPPAAPAKTRSEKAPEPGGNCPRHVKTAAAVRPRDEKPVVLAAEITPRARSEPSRAEGSGLIRRPWVLTSETLLWLFLGALIFGLNLLIAAVLMDYAPVSDAFIRLFRGLAVP